MSRLTTINGLQVPQLSDTPDIETSIGPLADAVDTLLVPRFTSPTDRAAKLAAPTEGQMCYVISTHELMVYNGTAWVGAKPRTTYKVTDQTVTDSVTLVDCASMGFTVEANSWYRLTGTIRWKSTGTNVNNIQMCFTAPAGSGGSWNLTADMDQHTGATPTEIAWGTSYGFGVNSAVLYREHCHGILATGSTAGNLQFQFAENTAVGGVTSVTVASSSGLELLKIA